MMLENKAIINDIPFEKFYQSARKEASRKKPVFFIHKYFARRITTNFRLALLASIYDKNNDIYNLFYQKSIDTHRDLVILDPFMGGGTTILESARFNAKVIGNDIQPLSLFVTEALIKKLDEKELRKDLKILEDKVSHKIKSYYKTKCIDCNEDSDIMYTFHVKLLKSTESGETYKLFNNFVLSLRNNIFTLICPKCGDINRTSFKDGENICSCGYMFNSPRDGYVKRGVFTSSDTNESFVLSNLKNTSGYPFSTKIIALEYYCNNCKKRNFKKPDNNDLDLYLKANEDFVKLEKELPIPTQKIPTGYNTNQMINHGYIYFSDMFNKRQLLCLGLLLNEINNIQNKESQFWLQLAFSDMLEMNNMFCRYQSNANKIANLFFNHAYVPITTPVENNVWGAKLGTGTFIKTIEKIIRGKKFNRNMYDITVKKDSKLKYQSIKMENEDVVATKVVRDFIDLDKGVLLRAGDSRNLDFIPDESVDIILTDPPYGANIMYSQLIDFFHVWNYKSSLAKDLGFTTELSPKTNEIIVDNKDKDYQYYEDGITSVFKEGYRKLKNQGLLIFSFHDKNLDSWLSVLNSIYSAGFILVQSYPMQSETRTGAHTSNKNSIGIDIMLVCKKTQSKREKELKITKPIIDIINTEIENKLKRLESSEAEITLGDIENIAIAEIFKAFSDYSIFDEGFKKEIIIFLEDYIKTLEDNFSDIEITKVRSGWWSELYRKKWDI